MNNNKDQSIGLIGLYYRNKMALIKSLLACQFFNQIINFLEKIDGIP